MSNVRYIGLHGTSTRSKGTVNLSCSETVPCTGIVVDDVEITGVGPEGVVSAVCINAHGTSHLANPPVDCLQP